MPVDFIVRGEGEVTFRELTRALDLRCDMHFISGFSHRCGDRWIHHQHRLEDDEIRLPDRSARVLTGYTILSRQADVVETSRGRRYDCSFWLHHRNAWS